MANLRKLMKGAVEQALVAARIPRVVRLLRMDRIAVLAYHNIVPEGAPFAGDRSLHLPQAEFARQLDILCESHAVVTLDALQRAESEGESVPRAVITFDDAYVGALTAGVEELSRRGLTGVVFVSPGCLEQDAFWWDQLADPDTGTVPTAVRNHAVSSLQGRHSRVIDWARSEGLSVEPVPEHARPASAETLAEAVRSGTVSVQSHTWSHPSLPSLSPSDLREELERSREWINERLGVVADWVSYPYGHWAPHVSGAAERTYAGGLLISGGLAQSEPLGEARYQVPRINIPSGLSPEGFELRLGGLR